MLGSNSMSTAHTRSLAHTVSHLNYVLQNFYIHHCSVLTDIALIIQVLLIFTHLNSAFDLNAFHLLKQLTDVTAIEICAIHLQCFLQLTQAELVINVKVFEETISDFRGSRF